MCGRNAIIDLNPDRSPAEVPLTRRQRQIAKLLLEGCENAEIARQLGLQPRTVKSHLSRMFLQFQIVGGIKRVKLATLLYRKQCIAWQQPNCTDPGNCAIAKNVSSDLSTRAAEIAKSPPR